MDKNKAKIISTLYPELAPQIKQQETNDLLRQLIDKSNQEMTIKGVEMIKGDKGDRGDDGYTPIKGVDYVDGYTPIKNVDYFDGEKGEDGKSVDEEKLFNRLLKEIPDPIQGETGKRGKDGSPDSPEEIVFKINTLEGVLETKVLKGSFTIEDVIKNIKDNKSIELRDIKGARLDMNDQRWHGGGLSNITGLIQAGANITITGSGTSSDPYIISSTGSSYMILQKTGGVIDDSNLAFTFASLPTELVINGGSYIQTGGSTTWTWNAGTLTATISTPVGTGGSIYGRA